MTVGVEVESQIRTKNIFVVESFSTLIKAVQDVWELQDRNAQPRTFFTISSLRENVVFTTTTDEVGENLLLAALVRNEGQYVMKPQV